jgi:dTMP kinase
MSSRPFFVSLDGLDGSGKTTQIQLLADWLRRQGQVVTTCRDPGGTPIGGRIRDLLLDRRSEMSMWCEAFLYMASRSQLVAEVIRPALARGEIVISDRFLLANVAYQGHAGGLPPARLWEVGRLATEGLEPDLTFVLDAPPEVALARKGGPGDRIESRGLEFLARVRAGFRSEAERAPQSIRILDATLPAAAVQELIRQEVAHVLGIAARP